MCKSGPPPQNPINRCKNRHNTKIRKYFPHKAKMPSPMSLRFAGVIAFVTCFRTTAACANLTGCLLKSCDNLVKSFNVTCEDLEVNRIFSYTNGRIFCVYNRTVIIYLSIQTSGDGLRLPRMCLSSFAHWQHHSTTEHSCKPRGTISASF